MSLDGYAAGPQQSKENPLGIGGHRLHEWALPLAVWRAPHGLEGGEVNESTRVVEDYSKVSGTSVVSSWCGRWPHQMSRTSSSSGVDDLIIHAG
jgi:hypothetical protein